MADASRITSRQNQRVKNAARLRTRRGRERQGRILIDGPREILRALDTGVTCVEAFAREPGRPSTDARRAVERLSAAGAEVLAVSPEVYEKLCFGERDEGVLAVAETPRRELADLDVPADALVVVIEGVEKPGNLGAILRTADAAGADAVLITDGPTDLFNPNTIRASLGTVFRHNVCRAESSAAIPWLRDRGLRIVATLPDAETIYTSADLSGPMAIVLGSEAEGLSRTWRKAAGEAVRLPMHGLADSLNVSATAAVLLYEAVRQRQVSAASNAGSQQ